MIKNSLKLAMFVPSLSIPHFSIQTLLVQPGGLHIVAVGSVLTKAWELLKEGIFSRFSWNIADFIDLDSR